MTNKIAMTRAFIATAVAASLTACAVGEGLDTVDDKYRDKANNLAKLMHCKEGTAEVGTSTKEYVSFSCDVGENGHLGARIADTAGPLDDIQKDACTPAGSNPKREKTPNLPGMNTCYIRGENYIVYSVTVTDNNDKIISRLEKKDVPNLPKRV